MEDLISMKLDEIKASPPLSIDSLEVQSQYWDYRDGTLRSNYA